MAPGDAAKRRIILSSLFEYLKLNYDFERPTEDIESGQLSDNEVDVALSYKSDSRLGELRQALKRLENGTYGVCIRCKRALSGAELADDPAKRVCPSCEASMSMGQIAVHGSPAFRPHV
ncbi:MAG TPA: hypothetical protein VL221_15595 [Bacteroidota bacterium]|nr:hypothetical protein [Bacteroidota bacterium]